MIVKYSSSYLTISVYPEKSCIIQTWRGYCSSEEFRSGQLKAVELFVENQCANFICDATNATPLAEDDIVWAAGAITPKLRDAAMGTLNIVVPSSVYTRMTLDLYEKKEILVRNTAINYFGSLDSALNSLSMC